MTFCRIFTSRILSPDEGRGKKRESVRRERERERGRVRVRMSRREGE